MFDDYGDVLSVPELCELLSIGRNTAYRLLNTGSLPAFRIGRCWKIPKKAVKDFLQLNESVL